ncbi:MAG: hypothetical protein D6696_01085 [Acidobacteria bacterium]|nr:MAG: hypothetical protein D6696_01085 [Acidobacteriota bacterium]
MPKSIPLRLLLLLLPALAACRQEPPPPPARHLVLVTVDTLRADHVGAYGGDVATPNLDRLAQEGALVHQASTHVPLTRPAHVALMSGRLPQETGIRDNVSPAALPPQPLLAEVLRQAGFATAAFVSSAVVARASGLDRGFDVYGDDFHADPADPSFLDRAQKRGDLTLAEALAWLEQQRQGKRLFLWLHLYDPHDPYEPPEPYAARYAERPYAGEVAFSDALIGELDAALSRLGLAAGTLLVVTSDHGEGLGEHGERLHGFFVYESTLRVPLIARGPGVTPGTELDGPVGLVDLYPTLLERLGVAPPAGVELAGRSLASAWAGRGEPPPRPLYAESLVPRLHFGWSELRVARDGWWKYVEAPRPELYDLEHDPHEERNLVAQERRRARALRDAVAAFRAREQAAETTQDVDPQWLEQLHALGYVGGSSPASTRDPGADPKDKIDEFRLANEAMREGLERLHQRDFAASVARFESLLERGIESAELHLYLGRALLGQRRFADAAGHFQEAAARTPTYVGAWLGLAEAYAQQGDADAALAALRGGRQAMPDNVALRREEARLLRLLGRPHEARRALASALELAPRDAFLHAALAEVLAELDEPKAAIAELRRAVELEPEGARYWNALGMRLIAAGELAEAERAFRRASLLAPGDPRYGYNLALALLNLKRPVEARLILQRVLAVAPDFAPARERLAALDD